MLNVAVIGLMELARPGIVSETVPLLPKSQYPVADPRFKSLLCQPVPKDPTLTVALPESPRSGAPGVAPVLNCHSHSTLAKTGFPMTRKIKATTALTRLVRFIGHDSTSAGNGNNRGKSRA